MLWSYLVHIGFNMWREENGPVRAEYTNASPKMRFDKKLWDDMLTFAKDNGINALVMDLGEGVRYDSHPEIGAEGAWTVSELKAELKKMREMGITPIPKLNFSATHDEWMGEYSRMVSSKIYYGVVKDLIEEVCDIFEQPEMFHLGMDEEKQPYVSFWGYNVIRNGDFWWKDFLYMVDILERQNVRPWLWSDRFWEHPKDFVNKMPRSVIQSNYYYGSFYDRGEIEKYASAYKLLDDHGFDQMPCGMNLNIIRTVKHCMDVISEEHLKGFLQTSWQPTLEKRRYAHFAAMDYLGQGRRGYEGDEAMFGGWKGVGQHFASYTEKDGLDVIV